MAVFTGAIDEGKDLFFYYLKMALMVNAICNCYSLFLGLLYMVAILSLIDEWLFSMLVSSKYGSNLILKRLMLLFIFPFHNILLFFFDFCRTETLKRGESFRRETL